MTEVDHVSGLRPALTGDAHGVEQMEDVIRIEDQCVIRDEPLRQGEEPLLEILLKETRSLDRENSQTEEQWKNGNAGQRLPGRQSRPTC